MKGRWGMEVAMIRDTEILYSLWAFRPNSDGALYLVHIDEKGAKPTDATHHESGLEEANSILPVSPHSH